MLKLQFLTIFMLFANKHTFFLLHFSVIHAIFSSFLILGLGHFGSQPFNYIRSTVRLYNVPEGTIVELECQTTRSLIWPSQNHVG